MLRGNGFVVLHVPRCGGTSMRSRLKLAVIAPLHDGTGDVHGDVYIALRDPRAWYLSFAMYATRQWRDRFGLTGEGDRHAVMSVEHLQDSVRKLALGDCGTGEPYTADSGIGFVDQRKMMSALGVGFWSVLVSRLATPVEHLNALWLYRREQDLRDIAQLYQQPLHGDASMGRNATTHPSVDEVYDDELTDLINKRDGECFELACTWPQGVPTENEQCRRMTQ